MENPGRNDGSVDKLPFPENPTQHQEFEFEIGFVASGPQSSPAGQLFYNGQLLPHVFPSKHANSIGTYSRSTSSSVSGNDKLRSSRSNSTSSRSSSRSNSTSSRSSSRRTSIIESRDRKVLLLNQAKVAKRLVITQDKQKVDVSLLSPQNGSQRWQYITQTPVLNRKVSRRKTFENTSEEELITKKRVNDHEAIEKEWFGRRIFRSFVTSCKQCHAMEPSTKSQIVILADTLSR